MRMEINKLSKAYGEKLALDSFSYTFHPGVTAILGPNGAGKTTLMNLITDCTKRQSGEILYDGTDILKLGKAFRRRLGFMPQSQGMYEQIKFNLLEQLRVVSLTVMFVLCILELLLGG